MSLAALAAMFAFGAVAEEPQPPLPFELFHGADTFSNAPSDAAPEGHAGSEPEAHSRMAAGEHADTAQGELDHGGADAASSQEIEGIKAPYSEPGETAALEMDEQMETLEPYKLVRSLQFVQDAVVQGDHSAMEMQRFLIGVIDSRLRQADQSVFDDPRNVDAALIYAMSGGNPATLDILAIKDKFGNFDNEITTVLRAYLKGRAAKTQTELSEVVKIYRDTEIGPYITLVAANVMAALNDSSALQLFDWARLTAPGTLVEEASLRRSLFIAAQKNMVDEALHYAQLYARRFINSPYAGQYADLVVDLVLLNYEKVGDEGLSEILSFMDRPRKREIYLRIARKAAITGLRELAVFASDRAEALLGVNDKTPQAMAELYSGMARIPTDGVDAVLQSINALSGARLSRRDRALREAAKVVASEVVRKPVPDSFTQAYPSIIAQPEVPQAGEDMATTTGEQKKPGSSIFRRTNAAEESSRAAEEEAFKGYVAERKKALERIDKLLE
ncbi:MAG: chemotaxis protein [Hoeflea sp.]|nr:chemotaxis protein [Hoeflea sp.]